MNNLLKQRMTATRQASELQASDKAYEKLFREPPPISPAAIQDLPLDKLHPFFTADIGSSLILQRNYKPLLNRSVRKG